ncbi:tape measure protein [Paracidovorax oryzae]|uniref:tape measure protein n=1 Tax=Paracidovorax oryzae TaxID=862720 RepID=UPI0035CF148E
MSDDLKEEIVIGSNTTGVEAGVNRVKRSLADLGLAAGQAGKAAASGMSAAGEGGDRASKKVESATRSMQASLQRLIAEQQAGSKASREYWEALASQRNVNVAALKPLLDQLDAYKSTAADAVRSSDSLNGSLSGLSAAAGLAGKALAVLGVSVSAREFVAMADASTNVASRLTLVTSSTAELIDVQRRLFDVAQASRVSYTSLVDTYAQMARSTKDLGVSQKDMLEVTKTISQAVTISGGAASSAQAALVQLAQGFASGALRGEELNSVLEQTPRLAQAIADGLGVSLGKLREMGGAGELTAEKVLGALKKSASGVQAEFDKMATTVEQSITRLNNSMTGLVGAMDSLLGTTKTISNAFGKLSEGMDAVAAIFTKLGKQGPLREAASEVRRLDDEARRLRQGIDRGIFGPQAQAELDRINGRLELAKQRFRDLDKELGGAKDPRDQTGFPTRTQSYAAEAKRLEGIQASMGKVLNGLAGVKDDFYKDLNALYAGYQAGLIKLADYQAAVAKLIKESGTEKPDSGIKAEQSAYESLVASIKSKIAQNDEELRYSGRLTESDKLRLQMMAQLEAGSKKLTGEHKARALALLETLEAQEKDKEAIKRAQAVYQEQVAIQEELAAAYVAESRAREAGRQAVTDYVKGLDEANKMMEFELSVMGLSEQAREVAIEQYRIELELKKQIAAVNKNEGFDQADRDEEIARLTAAASRAKANASNKVFLDEWKNSVKQYDDIFRQGFADMLNRGEDGWKSFTRSLATTFKTTVADAIYKMFLQPFVVQIVGQFVGMTGGGGMLGMLGGGSGGTGSGAMDMLSIGKNIYSAITGGFQALSGQIATYVQSGMNFISGSGGLVSQGPIQVGGFANGVGVAGSYLAGAYGGIMGGRMISGGYSAIGSSGNTAVNVGTAIGAIFGPLGALIGGLLGGAVNRLFGRKLADSGIEGEFGGEQGFAGRTYQFYKGGAFRSNKTKYGELDEEVRKGLADQYNAMKTSIKEMGKVLGLGGEALDKFTARIKVSLQGLSPEDAQKKLQEEFAKLGVSMADLILGLPSSIQEAATDRKYLFGVNPDAAAAAPVDPVAQANAEAFKKLQLAGESSLDTLTRLATNLAATNGVFETLGHTMYAASLEGGDMASKLIDLFGGVDKFAAASADYFQRFYSAEEQREVARKQIEKQLATLDIKLPDIDASDARAQYRKLVEAQDLNTEAGRKAYAVLIQLAGAFDQVATAADDAAKRQREKDIADKRFDLEQRLLIAQGKDREALVLRRNQEVDALTKLDPELAKLVRRIYELEDAASLTAQFRQDRENAYGKLQNAITLENERLNAQLDVIDAQRTAVGQQRALADDSLSLITGVFDLVRSNARELYGQVDTTATMQAARGWAFVEQALATARGTGYLPEQAQLQDAIGAARGGLESRAYATQFEQDRDRLVLAGMLSGLEDISGKQKTAAEQQIAALEAQGKSLDAQTESINKQLKAQQEMLTYWRRQIDIANGTFDATTSIADAVKQIAGAINSGVYETKPEMLGSAAAWGGSSGGAGAGATPPAETKYRRVTSLGTSIGYTPVIDQALIERLDKLSPVYHAFDGTGDLLGLLTAIKGAGGTLDDLSILSGYFYGDWIKAAASVGVPAFAVGTNYVPYDTPAIVHKGERIIPAADNRALMAAIDAGGQGTDGAALVAEVRALRDDNRQQAGEILRLNARITKLLERWDGDGTPPQREEQTA